MPNTLYRQGRTTVAAINDELKSVWKSLPQDPEFEQFAQAHPEVRRLNFAAAPPLRLESRGANLSPELARVAIEILIPVGVEISKDLLLLLWHSVALKRLRSALGKGSLLEDDKDG
jgi:hypothetical protein